ncbi:conserved hypothetical protein [Hyella patelloides LEGE 07179]|uniref:Uncharacterized protein n=2 Tax=Hyella TaxID=945733 RepID=A0A563VUW6_9CYAN|nr:DUF6694 family lipoprotein [Hyella patelloides]VEP15189.1 conserved hypothetical protein [Hyella patelloides LEGE 07179]
MKSSIEKVRQSLPEDKRGEFERALQIIMFSQMKDIYTSKMPLPIYPEQQIIEIVDGKTGLEIIASAEDVKRKLLEEQKKHIRQEIKELEAKKASAENDKLQLAKFKVVRARFYKQKRPYRDREEELIIELTMKNGTTQPVSGGYFVGTLSQPDRSVPWLQESFSYSIPGGLEPEEEVNLRLAPRYLSERSIAEVPQDAVFAVEAKQLNGANKEPLFSACKFTQKDETKLKELKESLRHEQIIRNVQYDYDTLLNRHRLGQYIDRCPEDFSYRYHRGNLKVELLP